MLKTGVFVMEMNETSISGGLLQTPFVVNHAPGKMCVRQVMPEEAVPVSRAMHVVLVQNFLDFTSCCRM